MKKVLFLSLGMLLLPAVFAADSLDALQKTLQEELKNAVVGGELSSPWKLRGGDWTVRPDITPPPEHTKAALIPVKIPENWEKTALLDRCLATDLKPGRIFYLKRDFDDFDFRYQMKHATERNYWNNEFRFRSAKNLQDCYVVKRERFGKFSLYRYGLNRRMDLLAESSGVLQASQNQWIYVRVKAEKNRIQVFACTDGVNYDKFIDFVDNNPDALFSGKVGFNAPHRFCFRFDDNLWKNDGKKRNAPAWLLRAEQSRDFRKTAGSRETYYTADIDYFVADPAKAPGVLKAGKQEIALDRTPGEHRARVEFLLPDDAPFADFALQMGDDKADLRIVNRLAEAKSEALAPDVARETDFTTPVNKQTYIDCANTFLDKWGNVGGKVPWDERWGISQTLYLATGEKKYLDNVMEWARSWLADRRSGKVEIPEFNFAARPSFAYAAKLALEKGDFTPEERKDFRALVADVAAYGHQEGSGMMNRALGYAIPIVTFLEIIPDHPMRHMLGRYRDLIMSDFMRNKEILENSCNYLPVTALYLVYWIDDNHLEKIYHDPEMKNCFELTLAMVDRAGGIPAFADYGGRRNFSPKLIATFERLATVYRDGRYKWAARQMMRSYLKNRDLYPPNAQDVMGLARAALYADDTIEEKVPDFSDTQFFQRNSGHPDKLIMHSSPDKNEFYAMADFINGGEHGDNNSLAVVAVGNDGGQSLIDKGGREVGNHSLPLIRESNRDFPYQSSQNLGRWETFSYDLKLFWSWGGFYGGAGGLSGHQSLSGRGRPQGQDLPPDFSYDPMREFAFVMEFSGSGKVKIFLDNVRLVKYASEPGKPDKVLMLEDFEGGAYRWVGNCRKAEDTLKGGHCGEFLLDFSESPYIGKKFPMVFDVYDGKFDRIEFDLRFEPEAGGKIDRYHVAHIGDASGTPRNFISFINGNYPVKKQFFRNGKSASFAAFSLDGKSATGDAQKLVREYLFARGKFLWVRDIITPPEGKPFAAGPIWQIGVPGDSGANWMDAKLDTHLLFAFVPRENAAIELRYLPSPFGYYDGSFKRQYPSVLTQFREGKAFDGKPMTFDSILIPRDGKNSAASDAAKFEVLYDKDNVTLLKVGDVLALRNPGGKKFEHDGLATDCEVLFLTVKDGKVVDAENLGGNTASFKGTKIEILK